MVPFITIWTVLCGCDWSQIKYKKICKWKTSLFLSTCVPDIELYFSNCTYINMSSQPWCIPSHFQKLHNTCHSCHYHLNEWQLQLYCSEKMSDTNDNNPLDQRPHASDYERAVLSLTNIDLGLTRHPTETENIINSLARVNAVSTSNCLPSVQLPHLPRSTPNSRVRSTEPVTSNASF